MRLRTAFLLLFYILLVFLLIPFILACMLIGKRAPLVAVGKWAMRLSRRILGIRLDVRGLENADRGRPLIFMANHLSFLDGPLLFILFPNQVRIIIKEGVGRIPIVGPSMRFVGFLTVARKGGQEGKARIGLAARLMRERDYSFLIFPEGTRSRDGRLGPFRRGGFFLALESGAPIVPIAIRGTYEMMPRGRWYVGKGRVRVDFLAPIPSEGATVETMPDLMAKVRSAVAAGLEKGDA